MERERDTPHLSPSPPLVHILPPKSYSLLPTHLPSPPWVSLAQSLALSLSSQVPPLSDIPKATLTFRHNFCLHCWEASSHLRVSNQHQTFTGTWKWYRAKACSPRAGVPAQCWLGLCPAHTASLLQTGTSCSHFWISCFVGIDCKKDTDFISTIFLHV